MILEEPKIMVESVHMPCLRIESPQGVEKLELNTQGTWTFGRSSDNTVHLDDPFASRYHAKLQVNPSQCCYFVDLGSRNGTLLNQEPLTTPTWLQHGDRLSIGEITLIFEHDQENNIDSASLPQVLMLHGSFMQGEIWQEIFKTFNISMTWENSSTTLRQSLEQKALSGSLPKLLLIDVKVYSNVNHFCRWCRQTFPQISIFLVDSLRRDIPPLERKIMTKQGVLNFFPTMNLHNLVLKSTDVLQDINEVLATLGDKYLSPDDLLNIMKKMTPNHQGIEDPSFS